MNRKMPVALWTALLAAGCANAPLDYRTYADGELLREAMHDLTGVIVYDIFSPPQASRAYAYASIAAYEALRHDHAGYRSLGEQLNGLAPVAAPDDDAGVFLPLSSVHAFMTVGRALTFSQARMDSLRFAMHERFRQMGVPRAVFERSIAYGDTVAQHILAWAAQDRFIQSRGYAKYTVLPEPGRWVPTPPAYMDGVEPSWAQLRPFALDSAGQFKPRPPAPFDMTDGSAFRREVMEVFEIGNTLSEEQRVIAAFWDNNPYVMHVRGHAMFATKTITPGGHWMGIATLASRRTRADLMRTAEVYALTAIAVADGFIACWEEKYRSNLVRPETVINEHIDDEWQPLLQTPPFPEYTSGHSVISTAAARVLTGLFGDGFAFADSAQIEYGLPARVYSSFEQAAAEAAISRLYGGIHYPMAIEAGILQGRGVGDLVLSRVRTRISGSTASAGAGRR
jgi:membrane-associated phospholipid phosphatase